MMQWGRWIADTLLDAFHYDGIADVKDKRGCQPGYRVGNIERSRCAEGGKDRVDPDNSHCARADEGDDH